MACLLALAHYPELKEIKIEFRYQKIKTSLAARPNNAFIFKRKMKRKFIVFINNDSLQENGILFDEVSLNAQIGVLGHELAHILYYKNKGSLAIIGNGICYGFKNFKRKFEQETDIRTIAHGLGWQLYEFYDLILNKSNSSPEYRAKVAAIYLPLEDFEKYMN